MTTLTAEEPNLWRVLRSRLETAESEVADLRARLARAEQAYEDLHKRIRPISWACEASGCQHERLEATIARLTAERDARNG